MAIALSFVGASVAAPVALGECGYYVRQPDRTLNVAYAFRATVVDASDEVDPPRKGSSDYTWHVELRIDQVYAGHVPDTLVFNGWGVGCHNLRGNKLNTGDRILVAVQDLNLRRLPGEPFSGDTVVWRRADGHWHYAHNVVGTPEYPPDDFESYALRGARTTSDIVAIIDSAAPPETSTDGAGGLVSSIKSASGAGSWNWAVLASSFVVGLLAFLRRRSATSTHR